MSHRWRLEDLPSLTGQLVERISEARSHFSLQSFLRLLITHHAIAECQCESGVSGTTDQDMLAEWNETPWQYAIERLIGRCGATPEPLDEGFVKTWIARDGRFSKNDARARELARLSDEGVEHSLLQDVRLRFPDEAEDWFGPPSSERVHIGDSAICGDRDIYLARLKSALPPLLELLELVDAQTEKDGFGLIHLWTLQKEKLRPVVECLFRLGLESDGRNLAINLCALGLYALGPKMNEVWAEMAEKDPNNRPWLEAAFGSFPKLEQIKRKRRENDSTAKSTLRDAIHNIRELLAMIDVVIPQEAPTIYFHGGLSYSLGQHPPVLVSREEHGALQAFLESKSALGTRALAKSVSQVSRVMDQLSNKFPGAVEKPKRKGLGYFVRVQPAAK